MPSRRSSVSKRAGARESSTSDDVYRSPSRTPVGTAGTLLALSIEQHSAFHPYERLDHAIPPITLRSPPGPRGLLARAATSHAASGASDRGAGSPSAGSRSGARRGAALTRRRAGQRLLRLRHLRALSGLAGRPPGPLGSGARAAGSVRPHR